MNEVKNLSVEEEVAVNGGNPLAAVWSLISFVANRTVAGRIGTGVSATESTSSISNFVYDCMTVNKHSLTQSNCRPQNWY